MWVIKMNLGLSLQLLHKCFTYLIRKTRRNIIVPGKQRVVRVDNVEDEEKYNQFDKMPFFVDTTRINIFKAKMSCSNVIPYAHTDGEGKLVAEVFCILDPKDEKKHIVVPGKQRVVRVDNVEDEEEYNQFDQVPFFVDTTRINIIETKISYSNVTPYARTNDEEKLIHV
jgi:hypothetical protein